MKKREHFRIDVASIVFSIASSHNKLNYLMGKSYEQFLSTAQPEIFINVNYDGLKKFSLQESRKVFDSEGPWSLYKFDKRNAIILGELVPDSFPSRVALFDDSMKHIEIYSETEGLPSGLLPDPLEYPLAEILMICLLAQGHGLMVHSCGIDDNGRGYLFSGNSTHGKTTIAKLWKKHAVILNDENIQAYLLRAFLSKKFFFCDTRSLIVLKRLMVRALHPCYLPEVSLLYGTQKV